MLLVGESKDIISMRLKVEVVELMEVEECSSSNVRDAQLKWQVEWSCTQKHTKPGCTVVTIDLILMTYRHKTSRK